MVTSKNNSKSPEFEPSSDQFAGPESSPYDHEPEAVELANEEFRLARNADQFAGNLETLKGLKEEKPEEGWGSYVLEKVGDLGTLLKKAGELGEILHSVKRFAGSFGSEAGGEAAIGGAEIGTVGAAEMGEGAVAALDIDALVELLPLLAL